MRDAKGYILLQPAKDRNIVTYVMHTELSGDIPAWVANKYIHLIPPLNTQTPLPNEVK